MKYYYSYYSKIKRDINTTEEQLAVQRKLHDGVIITKETDEKNIITQGYDEDLKRKMAILSLDIEDYTKALDVNKLYKTFKIPKHSGGFRTITAPEDDLKDLQKKVLKTMFYETKYLPSNAAHGFCKNRNCKTALMVHRNNNSRWFLKLDIHNFFPSITEDMITNAMCKHETFLKMPESTQDAIKKVALLNGVLPQGSPLSPMLGNLVLHEFDEKLTKALKEISKNIVYTRYADDLLISSPYSFTENIVQIQAIIKELLPKGLNLSETKTRYGSFAGRNWNLGIMYNKDMQLTVGYKKKKFFKNVLHNYEKAESVTQIQYQALLGQISYAYYIEPEYMKPYMERVKLLRNKVK